MNLTLCVQYYALRIVKKIWDKHFRNQLLPRLQHTSPIQNTFMDALICKDGDSVSFFLGVLQKSWDEKLKLTFP